MIFDPEDHDREISRLVFPRQPRHDRVWLTDFYRPIASGEPDVVALQGVTVGPEVTERITQLERDGEFAEQLFTHGLGVQAAEGLAEWLHSRVREALGIGRSQARRYSWGYPPADQSEHTKVWELLGLDEIGMYLSDGFAVMPEQSTVAIVAHHPQGVYFGMKSGFIPEQKAPDELIAGSDRGGQLPPTRTPRRATRKRRATCARRTRCRPSPSCSRSPGLRRAVRIVPHRRAGDGEAHGFRGRSGRI